MFRDVLQEDSMHKMLRRLLPNAEGFSQFAVAITVDARGFTSFSNKEDSAAVAEFIKRIYIKIIDEYFPRSRFFKPTGDGLLIIRPYTKKTLAKVAEKAVADSIKLVKDFPMLCRGDAMISFVVPDKLGIGVSRGAVCGLASGERTLDYSGRPLNLSARLSDLARPRGVVLDSAFGPDTLPPELSTQFAEAKVYVRGVAEREPMRISYTKDTVVILPSSTQPIQETKWKTEHYTTTLKKIRDTDGPWIHILQGKTVDPNQIAVEVQHPVVRRGRRQPSVGRLSRFSAFTYYLMADQARLSLDYRELAKYLDTHKVKDNWVVHIAIAYPEG